MSGDARVPTASLFEAFGLPITVTRPQPDDGPITTTGVWVPPIVEEFPFGSELQRLDARKVMAIPKTSAIDALPRGTTVHAAEFDGDTVKLWRVDGIARAEADLFRVILTPLSDVLS